MFLMFPCVWRHVVVDERSQFAIDYLPCRLHAWGDTLQEAFEQCANAMFGYITTIEYVEMNDTWDIEAEGDDLESLLFHFLDEFLFNFCAEPNYIARVSYTKRMTNSNMRVEN